MKASRHNGAFWHNELPNMQDTATAPRHTDFSDPSLYTNRELSWLEFNQRVLDQATANDHPLLEREIGRASCRERVYDDV